MKRFIDWCLHHRTSVFVILVLAAVAGVVAYLGLPLETFPDIEQPLVFVSVAYPGVSPNDMETLVTEPLEDKLLQIAKLKNLSSSSREGFATIVAEFDSGIEVTEALRRVREKVEEARPDLPPDAQEPIVQEINFESIPVLVVAITGDESLVRLKETAEDLQEKIEKIPGVLSVSLSGGLEREVKVNVNPSRLVHYGIGVDDVVAAIANENVTIPGGAAEGASLQWSVRIPGQLESIDELRDIVIETRSDATIRVADVAEVSLGYKEQESIARLNGQPSVSLGVQKRAGENVLKVTDAVRELLDRERGRFPSGVKDVIVADFSREIRTTVRDLNNSIVAGLLLVVLVLYFFLGARNGLLVGIAVPLSMFLSFLAISLLGYTLNTITLFSLILALGMLVDNAIVVVENIYRQHHEGKPLLSAARDATREVGVAIASSTATTLLAFAPLLFWPGIVGDFMKVLPVTLIITLSASLLVALVASPVLSSAFMRSAVRGRSLAGDRLLARVAARYERLLEWVLATRARRRVVLLAAGGAFLGTLAIFAVFNHGVEFFPTSEPNQFYVEVEAPLGTRLETSDRAVREIERRLAGLPDVENVLAAVGASGDLFDFGTGGGTPHRSRVTIDLLDKEQRSQDSFRTVEQARALLEGIAGVRIDVVVPDEGPPTGRAVEIRLTGEDFAVLAAMSAEVQRLIAGTPGLARLDDDYETGKPELQIRVDRTKAALQGLATARIASTVRTAVNGTKASQYRVGTEEYDITVRFDRDYRSAYGDLLNLTVFSEGQHRPLANFATVELATGLSSIHHLDGKRVVTVAADALGRSSAEVLADVQRRLASYRPPSGYSLSFSGQDEEQKKAQGFLSQALLVALGLIFLLLVMQFDSVTIPLVILATVPLSLIGALLGLLVTSKPFGIIMTGIGVISLAGVVVNNAIVLIEYIKQLRTQGLSKAVAIVRAGRTRLRPVLLTAITTVLGLIPLTTGVTIDFLGLFQGRLNRFVQFGAESAAFWSGMGVVVIFGLAFATILTLVVVPVMYHAAADLPQAIRSRFVRRREPVPSDEEGELSA